MKIYVARHGQTQWNVDNITCGRSDIPLTEEGLAQAQLLAEKAAEYDLDLIIASPMLRARQTAQAVADKCGIPVILEERLMEQDYGIYDGKSRFDPGFLENKRHFAWKYPGGESMLQLAHRIYSALDDICRDYADKRVLLVCHGGVMRAIRTYFEDMTNDEYYHYSEGNATLREFTK